MVGSLGLLAGCTEPQSTAIETGEIELTVSAGPVRGCWAKVHLDAPGVHVLVTEPLAGTEANPPGTEARLLTVPKWADAHHTTLAINANFFARAAKLAKDEPDPGWIADLPVDLKGLSISDGRTVSPARRGDPELLVLADGRATVAVAGTATPANVLAAVSGIGAGDDTKEQGTRLVTAGRNTGATARVQPDKRHPRTAIGVTADGRTLVIAVVDGRQPGYSVGMTLPELAELMLKLGAHDALNLDGGGSSTFYYRRPDGSLMTNKPSGGSWRPVGNHLGVRLEQR